MEKCLRQRGLKGNPYKLLYGDLNELTKSIIEAKSKPINFSDDIAQRLIPFLFDSINKNGMYPFYCGYFHVYFTPYDLLSLKIMHSKSPDSFLKN